MASTLSLLSLSLLIFLPLSLSTAPTPTPRPSTSPPRTPPARPPTSPPRAPPARPPSQPRAPPARRPTSPPRTPSARPPSHIHHAPASKHQPTLPAPIPPARPPSHRYLAPASKPQPTSPAPIPSARPPSHRYLAPASKSQPTPPAPTPAPLIASPDQQMNNIIDAMIGSGDFGNWISLLMSAAGNSSVSATLFVPDDVALPQPKNPHPYPNQQDFDPFLFPYHAVPRRISFADLRALPVGSRLPTLLPGNSLLITNNSLFNFTVNDSPITHPDLYLNGGVSVQGIGEVFDYKRFGTERSGGVGPSENRPVMPPPLSPPPYRKREADPGFRFFPAGSSVSGARRSSHGFLFDYWFPIVLRIGNVIIYTFLAAIH